MRAASLPRSPRSFRREGARSGPLGIVVSPSPVFAGTPVLRRCRHPPRDSPSATFDGVRSSPRASGRLRTRGTRPSTWRRRSGPPPTSTGFATWSASGSAAGSPGMLRISTRATTRPPLGGRSKRTWLPRSVRGIRECGTLDRRLAELYGAIDLTHRELSNAVKAAVPEKTPNLSALLGPDLAARLMAQARGLDRLARLPASTIQVLGCGAGVLRTPPGQRAPAPPRAPLPPPGDPIGLSLRTRETLPNARGQGGDRGPARPRRAAGRSLAPPRLRDAENETQGGPRTGPGSRSPRGSRKPLHTAPRDG